MDAAPFDWRLFAGSQRLLAGGSRARGDATNSLTTAHLYSCVGGAQMGGAQKAMSFEGTPSGIGLAARVAAG